MSGSSDAYYSTLKSYSDRQDSKYAEDMLGLATANTCMQDKLVPLVPPGLGLEHIVAPSSVTVHRDQLLCGGTQVSSILNFASCEIEEGEIIEPLDNPNVATVKDKGKRVIGQKEESGGSGRIRHRQQPEKVHRGSRRSSSQPRSGSATQLDQAQPGFKEPLLQSPRPRARSLAPLPDSPRGAVVSGSPKDISTDGLFGQTASTDLLPFPSSGGIGDEQWDPSTGEPTISLMGSFSGGGKTPRLSIRVPPIGSERRRKKARSAPVSPTSPPISLKMRWAEPPRTLAQPVTTFDTTCASNVQVSVHPVDDCDESMSNTAGISSHDEGDDWYNVIQADGDGPYAAREQPPGIRYPTAYFVSPLNPWKNMLHAQDMSGYMALLDRCRNQKKRISPFRKPAFFRRCPRPSHSCHCVDHPPRTKWKDLLIKQHCEKQRVQDMWRELARSLKARESYSPELEDRYAYRDATMVFDLDEDMDFV